MTSKQKQRKAVERAKYQAYLERRAEKARRRRRIQVVVGSVVAIAIVAGTALWMGGLFTSDKPATAEPTPKPLQFAKAQQVLTQGKPATATLLTDQGEVTIKLDTKAAPKNSNSIAFLAKQGYYDNTSCHRLTTSDPLFILQCGDTVGDGSSTPGYTTKDENLPKKGTNNYPAGTVAMAKPQGGLAGAQFFIVYKNSTLDPTYTIVGKVTKGLDIVKTVAKGGVAGGGNDGSPTVPIAIESVTVDQA